MWWLKLAGWFMGGKSPLDALTGIYERYKDSADESERRMAEDAKNRRDALLAEQQAALSVRMASMGFWEMRVLTAVTLFFFVSHLGAVWLDTMATGGVLGAGAQTIWKSAALQIPELPHPMNNWEGAIILSLFGISAGERSVRSIAAAIAVRRK